MRNSSPVRTSWVIRSAGAGGGGGGSTCGPNETAPTMAPQRTDARAPAPDTMRYRALCRPGHPESVTRKVHHHLAHRGMLPTDGNLVDGRRHELALHRVEGIVVGRDRDARPGGESVRLVRIGGDGGSGAAVPRDRER